MKFSGLITVLVCSIAFISTVNASLNSTSPDLIDSLFSYGYLPDLKEIRRYFTDSSISDGFIWNLYEEGCQGRSIRQVALVRLTTNSLAVARFDLFKRFMPLLKAEVSFEEEGYTVEAVVFMDMIRLPYLTAEAIESQEFDELLQAAVAKFGEDCLPGKIYRKTLNLHVIKFLERRFPSAEFTKLNWSELHSVFVEYNLSVKDVLDGLRHYTLKGILERIHSNFDESDLINFPEIARLLREAINMVFFGQIEAPSEKDSDWI